MNTRIPTALSIAGSDPSGGAGIQADMKTMSALRTYAMSVPTALTSQSTQGVSGVFPVPLEVIRSQLEVLFDDITPDATKIGMLGSGGVIRMVRGFLEKLENVILDPVMVSTSGTALLDEEGVASLRELAPLVDLITPNLAEAAVLLGSEVARSPRQSEEQALALRQQGWQRVLLKGGHFDDQPTDVYADKDGIILLSAQRIHTRNTHGTGCTLSSAIAALRAHQHRWHDAVAMAKAYLNGALQGADKLKVGSGTGPLHHFHAMWDIHPL